MPARGGGIKQNEIVPIAAADHSRPVEGELANARVSLNDQQARDERGRSHGERIAGGGAGASGTDVGRTLQESSDLCAGPVAHRCVSASPLELPGYACDEVPCARRQVLALAWGALSQSSLGPRPGSASAVRGASQRWSSLDSLLSRFRSRHRAGKPPFS